MIPQYNSTFLNHISESAQRVGAEFIYVDSLNGRLALVKQGNRTSLFGSAPIKMWPFNSAITMSVVSDKELTIRLLSDTGLLAPMTEIGFHSTVRYKHLTNTPQEAHIAAKELVKQKNFPIVIKPNNSYGSKGLSVIHEASSIRDAIDFASEFDNGIITQEYIEGMDVRIFVLKGKPIVLIKRCSATIVGDGNKTISQLIKKSIGCKQSNNELRGFRLSTNSYILRHGNLVLRDGQVFSGFPISNLSQGGHTISMSTALEHNWHNLCSKIYCTFGLDFFAVDCRLEESSSKDIYVLEVNANPGIEMLFESDSILAEKLMDMIVNAALGSYNY